MPKQKRSKRSGTAAVSATAAYVSAEEELEAERAVAAALQQTGGSSSAPSSSLPTSGTEKATPALLLQQLRDPKPSRREHAAHALSALAENSTPRVLQALMLAVEREHLCPIRLLLTCVVDPSPGVQTAALRALNSLSGVHAPLADILCTPGSLSVVLSCVLRAATQLSQSTSLSPAASSDIGSSATASTSIPAAAAAAASLSSVSSSGSSRAPSPGEFTPENRVVHLPALVVRGLQLLWSLAENHEAVVELFTKEPVLEAVLPLVQPSASFPLSVSETAAEFLNVLSDHNQLLCAKVVQSPERVAFLERLLQEGHAGPHLRALSAGILWNCRAATAHSGDVCRLTLPILSDLLVAFDGYTALAQMKPSLERLHVLQEGLLFLDSEEKEERKKLTKEQLTQRNQQLEANQQERRVLIGQLGKLFEEWRGQVSAQQFALETISNMLSPDEHMHDGAVAGEAATEAAEALCGEIAHLLGSSDEFIQALHRKAAVPSAELMTACRALSIASAVVDYSSSSSFASATTDSRLSAMDDAAGYASHTVAEICFPSLQVVQQRAIACLANLLVFPTCPLLQRQSVVDALWLTYCQLCVLASDGNEVELLENSSQVLANLLRCALASETVTLPKLNREQIQFHFKLAQYKPSADVRVHGVACIGSLATHPTYRGALLELGTALLVALHDSAAPVVVEALDAIFANFDESDSDAVASKIRLIPTLQQVQKKLSTMFATRDLPADEHDRDILRDALENLTAFLAYKAGGNSQ